MKSNVSEKNILLWNLLGNLAAAAVSVIYLIIISRYSDSYTADKFSLSYSIGNLWVIIGLFQVRNYQSTDIVNKHSFTSYTLARIISILLMLLTIVPYLLFTGYRIDDYLAMTVAVVLILYRACDAASDLFQGLYQKHERLDIAGKSMTLRYFVSVIVTWFGVAILHSLTIAVFLLFVINLFFVYLLDYLNSRKFEQIQWKSLFSTTNFKDSLSILKICVPLFINGFLINLIFNEPKMAIEYGTINNYLTDGMQRDYNILFMPAFFMSLCILIIRPYITKLAIFWEKKNFDNFDRLCKLIILTILIGGISISVLAYLIGTPILSIVFSVSLTKFQLELFILVLAGVFYSLALVIENLITIFRLHKFLVFVYIFIFLISKIITRPFVLNMGILGAAISFLLLMLVYVLCNGLMYIILRRRI